MPSTAPQRQAGLAGIPFVLAALLLFITLDAVGKLLTERMPVTQVVWARFGFSVLFTLPFFVLVPANWAHIRTRHLGLQLWRSFLLAATTFLFFASVAALPLPTVTALLFATPLLVVMLSIPLLGEKVGPRRWLGVAAGWIGVGIVLKPGFGFDGSMALPLACALVNSFYQLSTRMLSGRDHPMTTFFYTGLIGAAALTVAVPFVWAPIGATDWAWLALAGALGAFGHLLLIQAYRRSEASLLAPFFYVNIVWSTLFSWAIWGAVPDLATYLGAGLIVAAGLYIWHRERIVARRAISGGTAGTQ